MRKVFQGFAYSASLLVLTGVVTVGGVLSRLFVRSAGSGTEVGNQLTDIFGIPVARADVITGPTGSTDGPGSGNPSAPSAGPACPQPSGPSSGCG